MKPPGCQDFLFRKALRRAARQKEARRAGRTGDDTRTGRRLRPCPSWRSSCSPTSGGRRRVTGWNRRQRGGEVHVSTPRRMPASLCACSGLARPECRVQRSRERTRVRVVCARAAASRQELATCALQAALVSLTLCAAGPEAASASIHVEPANALSVPTWAVHVSSVAEWLIAMELVWRYGDATGRPAWKGMSWGMLPLHTSRHVHAL